MAVHLFDHKLKRELYRQNKTINKNLRFLRLVFGYSQEELAENFHMGRSTYHSYEHGYKMPDYELVCYIADFYNIGVDYLVSIDITEQMVGLLSPERKDANAIEFLKKYLELSRGGRDQIKEELEEIYTGEQKYNSFPWKYADTILEGKGAYMNGRR